MKKIILVIAAMTALATSAFAKGGDFGFFQYIAPVNNNTIKADGKTADRETPAFFGIGVGGDWWLTNINDIVDFGLTAEGGINLSNGMKFDGDKDDSIFVLGGYVLFGPSFQFNLSKKFSLVASPCLGFDFVSTYHESTTYWTLPETTETRTSSFGFGLDLGVGGRVFFTDKFGLQFGLNTLIPFAGKFESKKEKTFSATETKDGDITSGFELRVKLGLIWRFGKN